MNTVFFGGGTPTLMTGAQMERMMDTLRACFDLAADAEVTMEGNPGTLTRENLDAYRKAGVNRLSLGVQSLDDGLLQSIGRIHTNEQARQAVRMARDAGFDNLNLDLMLGLPGPETGTVGTDARKGDGACAGTPELLRPDSGRRHAAFQAG